MATAIENANETESAQNTQTRGRYVPLKQMASVKEAEHKIFCRISGNRGATFSESDDFWTTLRRELRPARAQKHDYTDGFVAGAVWLWQEIHKKP